MPSQTLTGVAFDPVDGDLYRLGGTDATGMRELWRVGWCSGHPVGEFELVTVFAETGTHAGLAVVPEPSTVILFTTASLFVLWRRLT